MSDPKLPSSWYEISLKDVCRFVDYRGRTPVKTTSGVPLITAKNIKDGYINPDPKEYISEDSYDDWMTRGIPKFGDVVITTEAPMGNVAVIKIKEKFAMAQRAICLQFGNDNTGYFVHYALRSPFFQRKLRENATGTTVNGIKSATLKELQIPFPPMSEQKIIADKLDDLLARVESIKTRLENIPDILKKFRQSVLNAAVSGRLNSRHCPMKSIHVGYGWPHDVEGPSHWVEYKLSDIIKIVGGSQPPKSDFRDVCVDGYIRLIQIRDYKSDNHKVFIPRDKAKRFVYKDDVMIGRYGPPIFQILRGLEGAYNVALMKAVPNEEVIRNDYLYWYLQNFNIFNYVESGSDRTAGQSGVNKKHLESYPMLIPSLTEQDEIVKSLEIFFSYAKSIELKAIDALNKVNNLTQSILAKAFRGELTAQWREENPELISGLNSAEALLEKITAEKLAAGTVKKRAKKTAH